MRRSIMSFFIVITGLLFMGCSGATTDANPNSSKAITAFIFTSPPSAGIITESDNTIAVTVPYGTSLTALSPSITHTGASINPASGVVQNFSSPVTYTVTAADGTVQPYIVTVTAASISSKEITGFSFDSLAVSGVITEATHTIAVTVPAGTTVTSLTPTISYTGTSINPASGTAKNFTSAVAYTVTAADTSTQLYTVIVTVSGSTGSTGIIPSSWWGPYTRMDNGTAYYISSDEVGGEIATEATVDSITTSSSVYSRVAGGDGLTKVTQGSVIFYVYPKERRTGTFSGTVVGSTTKSKGAGGLTGIGNISAIITNINNAADVKIVTTDSSGKFNVPDAIPGDVYVVKPATGDNTTTVDVKPLDSGTDVGNVAVVTTAYNFKASSDYGGKFFFADGTDYNLTITVTNNGTVSSPSPIYTVTGISSGLTVGGTLTNNLQTIPAGGTKTISITVKADPITADYEDKKIGLNLAVYQGGTWDDSVTVRFWKNDTLSVYFQSEYSARACIITPEGRMIGFSNGFVTIPRKASGLKLALSGASEATETKYALAIGDGRTSTWTKVVSPGIDEPNDLLAEATPLYINDPSTEMKYGYLTPNEMDFYDIKSAGLPAATGITANKPDSTHVSVSWNAVAGAEKYYVYLKDVLQTPTGTASTSLNNVLITGAVSTVSVAAFSSSAGFSVPSNISYMVNVPAGTFQRDATPANTTTLSAFKISETEVTNFIYYSIMGGYFTPYSGSLLEADGHDKPVTSISWYSALVFCNKLSIKEGLTPVYTISGSTNPVNWGAVPTATSTTWDAVTANWSASGYRLPTEMEWMWAAMGGTGGTTGYSKAFAGSTGTNVVGDYAWTSENSGNFSHSVGTKLPNELGIYDMSGNAYELCWDWFSMSYDSGTLVNPRGAVSGTIRVMRGGDFSYNADFLSLTWRDANIGYPYDWNFRFGFRVVRP